jgi:hypothetical protein
MVTKLLPRVCTDEFIVGKEVVDVGLSSFVEYVRDKDTALEVTMETTCGYKSFYGNHK